MNEAAHSAVRGLLNTWERSEMLEDERMAAYLHSLDPVLPEGLYALEKSALEREIPIIRRSTQSLLRFLIRTARPMRILEIGTAVGFSALFMRLYQDPSGEIVTIEKVPAKIAEAKEHLREMDPEGAIRLLEGDAAEVLEDLVQAGEVYDMVFLDAAKAQYPAYLVPIRRLLAPGGLLVSDNVLQDGTVAQSRFAVTRRDRTIHSRMREFLHQLTHDEEFTTVILPAGDGVALSVKERVEE